MAGKSIIKNINNFVDFTPESSYLLGFLYADGHVRPNTNEIILSLVEEDMEKIKHIFQSVCKWSEYYYPANKSGNRNNSARLTLHQTNYLLSQKLKNSKHFLLSEIPSQLKYYWYRGFIDGDGCWTISVGRQRLRSGNGYSTTTSRKFIVSGPIDEDWRFFTDMLDSIEVNYHFREERWPNGNSSSITISKRENFLKLGRYIYDNYPEDGIGLLRKYNKYCELVSSYTRTLFPKFKE